jgi:predicted Fe-Mo cluster-binding NifX family protein
MKICIPSTQDEGLKSMVSEHFGRAPFHYIVNTKTQTAEILAKPEGEHGQCVPVQALIANKVETVLCKGIGRGAATQFSQYGIPVMRTAAATIAEAIAAFEAKQLDHVHESELCEGDGSHNHAE